MTIDSVLSSNPSSWIPVFRNVGLSQVEAHELHDLITQEATEAVQLQLLARDLNLGGSNNY